MRLTAQDYERLWSKAIEAAYLARLPEPMVFGQMVERAVLERVADWLERPDRQVIYTGLAKQVRAAAQEGEDAKPSVLAPWVQEAMKDSRPSTPEERAAFNKGVEKLLRGKKESPDGE